MESIMTVIELLSALTENDLRGSMPIGLPVTTAGVDT